MNQEQVKTAMVAVWGGERELVQWVGEQAAEDGSSLDAIWEAAIIEVAEELEVSADETDDVDALLFGLVERRKLEIAHANGLAERWSQRDEEDFENRRLDADILRGLNR